VTRRYFLSLLGGFVAALPVIGPLVAKRTPAYDRMTRLHERYEGPWDTHQIEVMENCHYVNGIGLIKTDPRKPMYLKTALMKL
jgi:hypothetical protein